MTDGRALARAYLEQQRLLGGDPVVMTGAAPADGRSAGQPVTTPEPSTAGPPYRPTADLPAAHLPPAGIVYDPPTGDLFTADPISQAMGLEGIAQLVAGCTKCRPPENRPPQYDEIAACLPYLHRQIEILKPKVILAMGNTAAQTLLNAKQSLGSMRNHVHRFRGIPVVVTYHPAALLRNPNWKRPTWDDVRIARRLLD